MYRRLFDNKVVKAITATIATVGLVSLLGCGRGPERKDDASIYAKAHHLQEQVWNYQLDGHLDRFFKETSGQHIILRATFLESKLGVEEIARNIFSNGMLNDVNWDEPSIISELQEIEDEISQANPYLFGSVGGPYEGQRFKVPIKYLDRVVSHWTDFQPNFDNSLGDSLADQSRRESIERLYSMID